MKRYKRSGYRVEYGRYGYYFAAPFVIGYLLFSLYPLAYTVAISFSDMRGFASNSMNFVGFDNYYWSLIKNASFLQTLKNTLVMWSVSYLFQFPLGIIVASWFCNKRLNIRGQGFYKFMIYMPNIITVSAIAVMCYSLFCFPGGQANSLLKSIGLIDKDIQYLTNFRFVRGLISYIDFWRFWGYGMLVTLAAMLGVNPELYEAADIDGANRWQSFWRITLPSIKNVMIFLVVSGISGGLQMYDTPKLLGTSKYTKTMTVLIYEQAFSGDYKYNVAAAMSMLVFLLAVIINLAVLNLRREKEGR